MEPTLTAPSLVGLGYASQADAFQRGREAAQMAKSHTSANQIGLALAFGPNNRKFDDFIEGVRLVTGEDALLGVPCDRVFLPDHEAVDVGLVVLLQLTSSAFSLNALDAGDQSALVTSTRLLTQIRAARHKSAHIYQSRGLLLFSIDMMDENDAVLREICSNGGFESWHLSFALPRPLTTNLVCQNQRIARGLVALEFLSNSPWGIGTVGMSAFPNQPDVPQRAIESAMRDANLQIQQNSSVLNLLFTDTVPEKISVHAKNTAIVVLSGAAMSARAMNRSYKAPPNSFSALAIPE